MKKGISPKQGAQHTSSAAAVSQQKQKVQKTQRSTDTKGLPAQLRSGVEALSGISMDGVQVHYNSEQPAQLNAKAYAQGNDIHLAGGEEKHLPHEAWHVVQQAQGRVKPTVQVKSAVPVNDDPALESEADTMGAKAMQAGGVQDTKPAFAKQVQLRSISGGAGAPVQRVIGTNKAPGTKVLHKTGKNAFYITGYSEEKGYELHHAVIRNSRIVFALPDDDAFDVLAGPDQQEQAPSSGLFSGFSALFGSGSSAEPSASGAYESARKADIAEKWPRISPRVQEIRTEVLKLEKAKTGSAAFYNAAGLGAHTLHRVVKAIYEEIQGVQTGNHVFFRAPGNPPRAETSQGPKAFLDSRSGGGGWSDHRERDSMMSTNVALHANARNSAESSFDILQTGGLFDVSMDTAIPIVKKMLLTMGLDGIYAQMVLDEVEKLFVSIERIKIQNNHTGRKESVLYQTFVPRKLVSQLVYISQVNGLPLGSGIELVDPVKVLNGIVAAGKELNRPDMSSFANAALAKLDTMSSEQKAALFQGPEFTRMALDAAKAATFWKAAADVNDIQARLLMHPAVFGKPSGIAETVTHTNLSGHTSDLLAAHAGEIKGAVRGAKASQLQSAKDRIALYGALYEKYKHIEATLDRMSALQIQNLLKETDPIVKQTQDRVQNEVWDFIGEHSNIQEVIDSEAGLIVTCRGKKVKFDLMVPAQMLPAEFEALLHLLHSMVRRPETQAASSTQTKPPTGGTGGSTTTTDLLDLDFFFSKK